MRAPAAAHTHSAAANSNRAGAIVAFKYKYAFSNALAPQTNVTNAGVVSSAFSGSSGHLTGCACRRTMRTHNGRCTNGCPARPSQPLPARSNDQNTLEGQHTPQKASLPYKRPPKSLRLSGMSAPLCSAVVLFDGLPAWRLNRVRERDAHLRARGHAARPDEVVRERVLRDVVLLASKVA